MIRTFLDLSMAHLPQHEAELVTTLTSDLGLWENSYESATGFFLWVGYAQDKLCPPMLRKLLNEIVMVFPDTAYVCLDAGNPAFPMFEVFEWTQEVDPADVPV